MHLMVFTQIIHSKIDTRAGKYFSYVVQKAKSLWM